MPAYVARIIPHSYRGKNDQDDGPDDFNVIILAYLGGSLSGAVLVSCCTGLPDPRDHGSHNPGATNVLRLGGRMAALVVVLDVLKGTVPVYLACYLQIKPVYLSFIWVAACLGHMYPIFCFIFAVVKGASRRWVP